LNRHYISFLALQQQTVMATVFASPSDPLSVYSIEPQGTPTIRPANVRNLSIDTMPNHHVDFALGIAQDPFLRGDSSLAGLKRIDGCLKRGSAGLFDSVKLLKPASFRSKRNNV
jgi:hypothetical protein